MRLSLGYQVLIAVIAGIAIGLFLGPLVAIFRPVASTYMMLLQMVVLPYIFLSIVLGLGSLTFPMAKQLLKKSWLFYFLLWGLVFFTIYLLMTLLPESLSELFNPNASTQSIKQKLASNLLTYLIPNNPIYDFVNNIVPAIAIFGLIIGIALMAIQHKEPFLSLIERGDRIIEKILDLLAVISPIGVFAHIAVGMGTVEFSELAKINIYLAGFILSTIFLTFWILPLILSSCTPLSFKESSHAIRAVGLLPFVTGISTIAIPFINKYLRKLGETHQLPSIQHFRSTTQTVVPLSYSFAQIGNGFLLFFILFASFYFRHPFTTGEKSLLSFLTIPLSIGSSATSVNSVSFLFTELNFPENAIELYTATMPITMNFQVLLSVGGVLTFILLVLFANDRRLQMNWKKMFSHLIGSLLIFSAIIFAIKPYIHIEDSYRNLFLSRKIQDVISNPPPTKVYLRNEMPIQLKNNATEVLAHILSSGVLRVGYEIYDIPYAYLNRDQELVGFDVAIAYQLAKDLNCRLEFIPMNYHRYMEDLNDGVYDIAMSALLITEERIKKMSFTNSYSEQNFVLLVPFSKKAVFADLKTAQKNQKHLTIGAVGGFQRVFDIYFPNATRFEGNPEGEFNANGADAWIWAQVPAKIWCLNHPDYIVMDYDGRLGKCFLGYPVRQGSRHFLEFMNNWIQLKILDGFFEQQKDYWILGSPPPRKKEPRWSIIRNVLHWVK